MDIHTRLAIAFLSCGGAGMFLALYALERLVK